MSTRLRTWARTGDYLEDPESERAWRARTPRQRRAWLESVGVAALVPIGIVVGALLAVAVIVRLVTLPLRLGSGSARSHGE